jgi:hypothetical protein
MQARAERRREHPATSRNGYVMTLAYAPEIAQVMVESALKGLSEREIVVLDDERKAAMVSNLLVVLCSDNDTQPIINTGTLYG